VLRRLHEGGFAHRDLKAPNVMVQWDGDLRHVPRVLLVDLDGIRQVRQLRPADEIRALARLSVSLDHCRKLTRTDRLRFLTSYSGGQWCAKPQWKSMWKSIERMVGQMPAALRGDQVSVTSDDSAPDSRGHIPI
jgi:serine/threonine protein kinase